jgi:cell division protein FtsW
MKKTITTNESNIIPLNPPKKRADFLLFVIVMALVIFGVVMVFSASFYGTLTTSNDPYYYLLRGGMWAAAGLVLLIAMSIIDYRKLSIIAVPAMAVALLLLLVVLTPIGINRGGAQRWLGTGNMTIMPGEIVKICSILFVAWYYTKYAKLVRTFTHGFLPILALTGFVFFLIYKQPNLSTAIIVAGIMFTMMYFAGVKGTYFWGFVALAAAGLFILVTTGGGEHQARATGYLTPFDDASGEFYQLVQSLLALGAGGVFGVGPGQSVSKALYLPEAQNDFIFAIFGEEYGFVGCIVLLLVYLVLIWRCALVAVGAPDRFGMLTASGITMMLALQVILNVAVVTGVIPPTGVTLPFISYGGNAMMLFMGSMGIMLNISRAVPRKKKKKSERRRRRDDFREVMA